VTYVVSGYWSVDRGAREDSGEAERWFRREAERHSGTNLVLHHHSFILRRLPPMDYRHDQRWSPDRIRPKDFSMAKPIATGSAKRCRRCSGYRLARRI